MEEQPLCAQNAKEKHMQLTSQGAKLLQTRCKVKGEDT
jgi:hypothetical protein